MQIIGKGTCMFRKSSLLIAVSTTVVAALLSAGPGAASAPERHITTAKVVKHEAAPNWVSSPNAVHVDNTDSVNVDFKFWSGGWEIKWNWTETKYISRGFGYCAAAAAALGWGLSTVVAASCGIGWIIADIAVSNGKCLRAWVPVSLISTSFGYWGCSH